MSLHADRPPTALQAKVLRLIAASIRELGWPPTLREICVAMGLASTNGAKDHICALERKGLVTQAPLIARGLALTERGRAFIEGTTEGT
jgi:repressor LexA